MTSEKLAVHRADEAHRIFKLSFIAMAIFGVVTSFALFFGARLIIRLAEVHPDSYYAMVAIAPALLLIPIMSVYRGYFQGMQNMLPTALSQFTEQVIRVAVGLVLAVVLLNMGVQYAAAGATFGASVGPIFGILIIAAVYLSRKKQIFEAINVAKSRGGTQESAGSILKTLAVIAIPITIGVSIYPVMNLADMIFVQQRLVFAGYSEDAALALYGQLSGFAGPIINVPMTFALSMALSMVPAIASAKSANDIELLNANIKLGFRTSMIVGVPCSFGIIILAEPIMRLLFPLQEESGVNAAVALAILAGGIIFLCIAQTMAGVLQGLGKIGIAVLSLSAGFLVKCIVTFSLTPGLGIEGAAIGSVVGFITVLVISFAAVCILTKIRFDFVLSVVKPLISGIVMTIVVLISYRVFDFIIAERLATALAICLGAAAYGITLIKIKAITEAEIMMFPKGAKIVRLLQKLRLL
jgi:stage V sporulation protein B